jgi:hypothetical protein
MAGWLLVVACGWGGDEILGRFWKSSLMIDSVLAYNTVSNSTVL